MHATIEVTYLAKSCMIAQTPQAEKPLNTLEYDNTCSLHQYLQKYISKHFSFESDKFRVDTHLCKKLGDTPAADFIDVLVLSFEYV